MNNYCSHISVLSLKTKLFFLKFCHVYLYGDDVLGSVVRLPCFLLTRMRWGIAVLIGLSKWMYTTWGYTEPYSLILMSVQHISWVISSYNCFELCLHSLSFPNTKYIHPLDFWSYKFLCLIKERKLEEVTTLFAKLQTFLSVRLKRVLKKINK